MKWQITHELSLPDLTTQQVQVYLTDLDQLPDHTAYLSAEECQRANKMPVQPHRQRFINARGFLRYCLAHYLQQPAKQIILQTTDTGKLYLPEQNLYFNLAHSHHMAVFAFNYDHQIGIDLEEQRALQDLLGIAERVFSDDELTYLRQKNHETIEQKFFKLWTRKEAVIKATGEGLGATLKSITTTLPDGYINQNITALSALKAQLHDLPNTENFAIAVAAHHSKREILLTYLQNT